MVSVIRCVHGFCPISGRDQCRASEYVEHGFRRQDAQGAQSSQVSWTHNQGSLAPYYYLVSLYEITPNRVTRK